MKAAKLFARDARKRRALGWPMAFIAPEFPKPRNTPELVALSMLPERAVTLHVYDVAEMLERAYRRGRADRKE